MALVYTFFVTTDTGMYSIFQRLVLPAEQCMELSWHSGSGSEGNVSFELLWKDQQNSGSRMKEPLAASGQAAAKG